VPVAKFKIYYFVFARSALSISGLGRSLKLSVEKIAALYKKAAGAKRNYTAVRPLWRNTHPSLLHVFSWPPFWRFTAFNKSKHPCCKNLFATAAWEMRARELPFTPASSALALITSVPALSQRARARPFLLKATEKEGSQQTSLLRTASSVIFQNIVLRPSKKRSDSVSSSQLTFQPSSTGGTGKNHPLDANRCLMKVPL
jgi:hypothetical protein